jgi:hypothetical protein
MQFELSPELHGEMDVRITIYDFEGIASFFLNNYWRMNFTAVLRPLSTTRMA